MELGVKYVVYKSPCQLCRHEAWRCYAAPRIEDPDAATFPPLDVSSISAACSHSKIVHASFLHPSSRHCPLSITTPHYSNPPLHLGHVATLNPLVKPFPQRHTQPRLPTSLQAEQSSFQARLTIMSAVDSLTENMANTTIASEGANTATGGEPINAAENEAVIAAAAEGRRLYIGNLAYATTEGELKSFFTGYSMYVCCPLLTLHLAHIWPQRDNLNSHKPPYHPSGWLRLRRPFHR